MLKNVLVTGASGSFGNAFVATLLQNRQVERIVCLARGEQRLAEMEARFHDPRIRILVGDVRDKERLHLAMRGCDTVVHAAALKRVDLVEYNILEAKKTNIDGAENIVLAALATPTVRRVLALSTDKASQSVNGYGSSKFMAEKIFTYANCYSGHDGPLFSCVRYGNVAASNGSVIPLWQKLAKERQALPITDERMTRFYMTLDGAVALVLRALGRMRGGDIFIPKIPSFKLTDLAKALGCETRTVGLRPGEKLHESLIGPEEAHNAYDLGTDYCLSYRIADEPGLRTTGIKVPDGFVYSSDKNDRWLTVEGLKQALAGLDALKKAA